MEKNKYYLKLPAKLSLNQYARKLQGFLLEQIESDYADYLHQQEMNPYTSCLYHQDDQVIWELNLLTQEAIDQIGPVIYDLAEIKLESIGQAIEVDQIIIDRLSSKDLAEDFYRKEPSNYHKILFKTPTSFKQRGHYIPYPDPRLLIQSLMMKVNYIEVGEFEVHPELLEEVVDHVSIAGYNLKTVKFEIHRQKIPSFIGNMTLKVSGNQTLKSYLSYLLTMGEYTGVGIKTSIGMGAVHYDHN